MAVYRIGDIIRMKREALGITREKLCELSGEACSPQTLYRMECGKVKVKQEVYRKLMECMGELPERSYASIKVTKYQALNLKMEIHNHLVQREYEQAEEKLEVLEAFMEEGYVRNKQYLLQVKSKLAYFKQQLTEEAYLDKLWEALRCTIPSLDSIELRQWPVNCVEFEILLDILNVYIIKKWLGKEEELTLALKENIEKKYMDEDYYVVWHTQCLGNLSRLSSIEKQHEKAIEYAIDGVSELQKQKIIGYVYNLLYDTVWNKENMMSKNKIEKKNEKNVKNFSFRHIT